GLQLRERFANHRAAEAELARQCRFGRELGAGDEAADADAIGQLLDDAKRKAARPAALEQGEVVHVDRAVAVGCTTSDNSAQAHFRRLAFSAPAPTIALMATASSPTSAAPAPRFDRLLLTGAAGSLRRAPRPPPRRLC